eukprot:TRINITY_DN14648_c0_g1_i1.p1 TRINITY_DN14648_c0_g1~~TRINITY_DN14648_c0_g1_i1.p1  ORF type:complete len:129 (+),score=21.51 TRINITY_DN14648_c0_g1_i1:89-475(+)
MAKFFALVCWISLESAAGKQLVRTIVEAEGANVEMDEEEVPAVGLTDGGIWKGKDGEVDCTNMKLLPYCSLRGITDCDGTYQINSGIGYKCFWDTKVWPPACAAYPSTTTPSLICKKDTCGGAPSYCW